ncbi:NAD(P)-dependent oxidoreductase [Peribacillus frigoritolerans]|uniref:NAD(P)-dependent oxidoreductase n=1 Tax=Peribacillus frigoritolerans TaxID=450367 RepID=UPI00345C65DD
MCKKSRLFGPNLPITDSTYHIINKDLLLAMKSKAYLINVGREALIDEGDLIPVIFDSVLSYP